MPLALHHLGPPSHTRSARLEDYDSSSETECPDADSRATQPRSRAPFVTSTSATGSSGSPHSNFLFPPSIPSGRSSVSSTATSTPIPSRSSSPLPQFFSSDPSSGTSDTDSEPDSPLLQTSRNQVRSGLRQRRWWALGSPTRRRRRRDIRYLRVLKKWTRLLVRHPFFPKQPITIVLTLLLLSLFAVLLTLLLIYILNPDKEPLPWRAYCSVPASSTPPNILLSQIASSDPLSVTSAYGIPPPFPPPNLDSLPATGLFVGVFSMDSAFERRMLMRTTWASHPRSRNGAGDGDGGTGTSRTVVKFILGQPRKSWERRIKLEMDMYNDIIVLPVVENMNLGKTHTFFSWASINAWVPPVYSETSVPAPRFSYSNETSSPPPLAPHDSHFAWNDRNSGTLKPWVRPDFVVKVDDDSFVMLAELEARLRLELHTKPQYPDYALNSRDEYLVTDNSNTSLKILATNDLHEHKPRTEHSSTTQNDPLVYWGYLVKNRFMAGELYALSWSLTNWVAKDPVVKTLAKGAEDKQTAKWMRLHPRASDIRWTNERCWIYDHPRGGTVYSHGFLYPSEVTRVKRGITSYLEKTPQEILNNPEVYNPPTPSSWAHSSVSTFGVRYSPPLPDLTIPESVEALVEGSDMSTLREGSPMTPEYAWTHREGRQKRYENKRVGGTVVVHFIKKNMWFLETAMALLEGEEFSESEKYHQKESERAVLLAHKADSTIISA